MSELVETGDVRDGGGGQEAIITYRIFIQQINHVFEQVVKHIFHELTFLLKKTHTRTKHTQTINKTLPGVG